MAKKSVIIRQVATDGRDKWATWAAVAQKPTFTAHLSVAEDSERRKSREWFPKNPQMRKGWGKCFIIVPPPPILPPLPLRHFIFHLSHHTSRFKATNAANARLYPDLSDGAKEESREPVENKPKEGGKWS